MKHQLGCTIVSCIIVMYVWRKLMQLIKIKRLLKSIRLFRIRWRGLIINLNRSVAWARTGSKTSVKRWRLSNKLELEKCNKKKQNNLDKKAYNKYLHLNKRVRLFKCLHKMTQNPLKLEEIVRVLRLNLRK